MGEIRYIKTSEADIELLMQVRLEMLREVNDLSDEYVYDETLVTESRKYFENCRPHITFTDKHMGGN